MDITSSINLIFDLISDIISVLDTTIFTMYGFSVSLWSILLVFIVISIFASVWWKGAKG